MLRRLLAALLVAAIAMPIPAIAIASAKSCPMKEHAGMAADHHCCCNDAGPAKVSAQQGAGSQANGHKGCPMPAAAKGGCECAVKADPGRQPVAPVAASFETPVKAPAASIALLPAALSTPQRQTRAVHVVDPPPAQGLVSRPLLCSWIL